MPKMVLTDTQLRRIQQIETAVVCGGLGNALGTGKETLLMKIGFWELIVIADKFGNEAVNDTFKRAFTEWKGNYAYLTEMVMVLFRHASARQTKRYSALLRS